MNNNNYREEEEEEDNSKPKRLEEETINYLQQIDHQLSDENTDSLTQQLLVKNVLDEMKTRTASAACDRHTNAIIERLIFSANLEQLIDIVTRITPYIIFLSSNRHSSHVVQSLFARLGHVLKYERDHNGDTTTSNGDDGDGDDNNINNNHNKKHK